MAAGIAGVPSLTSNKGVKEFIQHQESWWNQYTDCVNFDTDCVNNDNCSSTAVQCC